VGIRAARTDALGDRPADGIAVRKQIIEDIDDGRVDIAVC
jgi:hypothetical protein